MKSFSIQLEAKSSRVVFPENIDEYDALNDEGDAESGKSPAAVLLFDENTIKLFPKTKHPYYVIPSGEQQKNSSTLLKIAEWALSVGATRDTTFIAVGGGVVCDIAAFTASIYMRGVPVILVPTTLLAMVDASLGGKTGIDFQGYKNILGSFYPADEIRIFPSALTSLPQKEYLSGLAEVIKQSLLRDPALLEILQHRKQQIDNRNPELLADVIYKSQLVKQWYIEQDPYERDVRGHLNLGHTFGHALESIDGFNTWSHGEAVSWGIGRAMLMGLIKGVTPDGYAEKVFSLLRLYGYQLSPQKERAEKLMAAMEKDKKKKQGKIRFILQSDLAKTDYYTADKETVLKSLRSEIPPSN